MGTDRDLEPAREPAAVGGIGRRRRCRHAEAFTFTGGNPNRYADIFRMYFLVNPAPAIPRTPATGSDRSTNGIYLYNDALTALLGPLTRHIGTLQNSQCVVYGSSSSLVSARERIWASTWVWGCRGRI